jgi:UDP-3-O-[3-hydroxymyristoyl] N-acetylglucosamine deacetylase
MDGLPGNLQDLSLGSPQRTLKASIGCVGIGLHSGRRVSLQMHPAEPDTGVVFRRVDLGIDIPARFHCVTDTRLCTLLSAPDAPEARVGTVEHLMAALTACGVDNVIIEVDGPEIPVLDGSASPFVFLIDCAGLVEQATTRRVIEVLRAVRVEDGESFVELRPALSRGFEMAVSIAFDASAIGRQAFSLRVDEAAFRHNLASARTFAMSADIAGLQAAGLARGGNLGNAVVVDGARVLNPGGLRMTDEFVRHKMLDIVGDLALAGAPLQARVVAHRPGHSLNNRLLRALFADPTAWAWADAPLLAGWASAPMAAATV